MKKIYVEIFSVILICIIFVIGLIYSDRIIWEGSFKNKSIQLQPVTNDFSISFKTIDFRGIIEVKPYTLIDYLIPIRPILDRLKGEPFGIYKVYGSICDNRFMFPFDGPITNAEIFVLTNEIKNKTAVCFRTGPEYIELTVNGETKDITFNETDCEQAIFERDDKYYLNLSYKKMTCWYFKELLEP